MSADRAWASRLSYGSDAQMDRGCYSSAQVMCQHLPGWPVKLVVPLQMDARQLPIPSARRAIESYPMVMGVAWSPPAGWRTKCTASAQVSTTDWTRASSSTTLRSCST